MRTDTIVKTDIALIIREPFDYTAWRSCLQDESLSLRELSHKAMEEYTKSNPPQQLQ